MFLRTQLAASSGLGTDMHSRLGKATIEVQRMFQIPIRDEKAKKKIVEDKASHIFETKIEM